MPSAVTSRTAGLYDLVINSTVQINMLPVRNNQIYGAVDARARVPACVRHLAVMDKDLNFIVLADAQFAGQVNIEIGVAIYLPPMSSSFK